MSVSKQDIERLTDYIEQLTYNMESLEQESLCDLDVNVGFQEFKVIFFLGENGSTKMSEIAKHLMISSSNLTAIVDKLVKKKLVKRYHNEDDRRTVFVELLGAGNQIFLGHRKQKMKISKTMLETLDAGERKQFIGLMEKIAFGLNGKTE